MTLNSRSIVVVPRLDSVVYKENTAWLHAMHAISVVSTGEFLLADTFMVLTALHIQTTSTPKYLGVAFAVCSTHYRC